MTLYAADSERMQLARDAIDQWFEEIDDAGQSSTYELLVILNNGLSNVSYTLTCYRNKVRAISYISQHCAAGDGSIDDLYDIAEGDFYVNDNDCIDDSGYQYTTREQIVAINDGLAEDEVGSRVQANIIRECVGILIYPLRC